MSRAQLAELGFGPQAVWRRVQAHRLPRLHPGVFAVGHTALTRHGHELAAVFACGPGALLSHRAAGRRLGLLGATGAPIDVTASRGCKPKPGVRVHRTRMVHPDDRIVVDGIAVTSMARTLVDLADVLDERSLAAAVNEAEVMRHFDLRAIERTQARLPGRRGRHRLRRVLATYTEAPGYCTTEAERLFLDLCGRHALPPPRRVSIAGYELDFYWDDARLAIEIDGATYHATRRAFHEDRRRDRHLAGLGIQVARVPWRDLVHGEPELARELAEIRASRRP